MQTECRCINLSNELQRFITLIDRMHLQLDVQNRTEPLDKHSLQRKSHTDQEIWSRIAVEMATR